MDGRSLDDIDDHYRDLLDREPVLRVPLSRADAAVVSAGGWTSNTDRMSRCPDGGSYPEDTAWMSSLRAEAVGAVLNVEEGRLPELALSAAAMKAFVGFVSDSVARHMKPHAFEPAREVARRIVFSTLRNAADQACRDYASGGGQFTAEPVLEEAPAPRR